MNYYIVTNPNVIDYFKKSSHFKIKLGKAHTMVKDNGERVLNLDGFEKKYYVKEKHIIRIEGNVGVINFYSNPYMIDNVLSVFDDEFNKLNLVYDLEYMNSVSYNSYIGEIMYEFNKYHHPVSVDQFMEDDGDGSKLKDKPWDIEWKDIVDYKTKMRNI